jgi:hypothetical protein
MGSLYEAFSARDSLRAELNRNKSAEKSIRATMIELVNVAWNGAPPPDLSDPSPDPSLDAATLVRIHDPSLVLELIAPAFAKGEPLENALIDGDPELAALFENPGGGDADPGFSLYLERIEKEGLDSPVSQALIERMMFVRPVRAMDLMLERHGHEIPDAMLVFGIHQGIRLQRFREDLGENRPIETLNWMTRSLSPLQGHELWWVRYYARRVLGLQVGRVSAERS